MTDLKVIEGGAAAPVKPAAKKRRNKRSRGGVPVGVLDAIADLVLSAQGIELAVMGEGKLSDFDSSPISRLIDMHIADVKAVADSLLNAEGES